MDFSRASLIAFGHALKIALQAKAEVEIVHVQRHRTVSTSDVHWSDFPGVRPALARWNILPADAEADDVAKLELRIKKILHAESDPLAAMIDYCDSHPPDLLVLATHQREGLNRWLHKPVAEPLGVRLPGQRRGVAQARSNPSRSRARRPGGGGRSLFSRRGSGRSRC